ncbi:molybdopterin-dependent oxidoreductase [Mycobacterium sp. MYCO198283]|uniref:molybdopterin-dependent oxidoreductase n=1 Tax=Mycobacterium sp. MYCO198283 TaxID=2883505 RepID=UPI001E60ACBA|nr:molybdopterin-dependent oxidoreductase [Mycobacterium sp. MYCO198283]MCG5434331.1 molybdopterin-dependent oxidoreductase [Mycobacterium sp. MYCO198283]
MAVPTREQRMISGIAAAAAALGVMELAAIPFGPTADSRLAVGATVIDWTPGPVKEWAIRLFGFNDKLVLSAVILVVIAALAAITARYEAPRRPVGSAAIVVAGALGCLAVLSRAGATPLAVLPTVAGTVCGVAALRFLTRAPAADDVDGNRRRSLAALGVLVAGVVSGVVGVVVTRQLRSVSGERSALTVPRPATPAPPIPPTVQPPGVALPRFVTPTADFYRIDTALSVPQLSRNDWRLRIHGLVDREVTFTFDDLDAFDVVEEVVTLTCVSNTIGGDLISNAVWTGYRVRDLLARAGVSPEADMVLSTSIDGFTAGTPVEALRDNPDSLLAIAMNGEPLPDQHGYPARLVVPGLYGYVSATKWVVDLELTRFDRAQAYWTKLGWSARGPIKTQSRIDVPRYGQKLAAGDTVFGGVAWAQPRGVRAVEIRIDDGDWRPAELGAAYSDDTWRLWRYPWTATPGEHRITVRAIDGTGAVQTAEVAAPVPDGATGLHSVAFTVS